MVYMVLDDEWLAFY